MFESNSHFDFDDIEIPIIVPKSITNKRCLKTHYSDNKKQRISANSCVSDQTGGLKKSDLIKSIDVKVISRKFPGPAGLLPEPNDANISVNIPSIKTDPDICSQMAVDVFWEGPWKHMIQDFQPTNVTDICLPEKYNIAWIKRVVKNDKLINQRAPFLAGVVENIKCSKTKPVLTFSFILKDLTGNVRTTITVSNDLYEEYARLLTNGVVIVLKQFGVLINENDSVHITTTSNNLVRIYTQSEVIFMQDFVVSDFIQKLKEVKLKHKLNISNSIASHRPAIQNQGVLPFRTNSIINTSDLNCTANLSVNNKRKFNFKQKSSIPDNNLNKKLQNVPNLDPTNTHIPVNGNTLQHNEIIKNIFEGIDTDALFDDF